VIHDRAVVGVIFDWDGVLLDSLGAAFNVYNKIFRKMGTKRLTKEEFLRLQSPNWYEFYSEVGLPIAFWKEMDGEWLRLYQDEHPSLHEDALACLGSLRRAGFKLALVSNGSRVRVERELAKFRLGSYFDVVLLGDKKEELKPSPVMLKRALRVMGLKPQMVVYVGDSPADIQAAKNAFVPSVAIAREPIQAERLRKENPDRVFAGLGELVRFLLSRGSS
jgi:HAD superfamily hydrolase (TIGR01509 family)